MASFGGSNYPENTETGLFERKLKKNLASGAQINANLGDRKSQFFKRM